MCPTLVAVDMSVAQTSILELKLAAIRQLGYNDYLVLLGEVVATGEEREAALLSVNQYLPAQAKVSEILPHTHLFSAHYIIMTLSGHRAQYIIMTLSGHRVHYRGPH